MRAIDWVLLATSGALLIAGPAMALQEWTRHQQAVGTAMVTGSFPAVDAVFRAPWRAGLLAGVIVAGVSGVIIALRIARQPKVRTVSARLLVLLLSGIVLFDLTYLADGRWFLDAQYAIRGATIVWLYPAAAILMGGAIMRLSELEEAFGDG